MSTPYKDPVVKKYIELFEANCKQIKGFYYGEPFKIPASAMPAIFISKVITEIGVLNNAQDEHAMEMQLTLVTDIRKTLDEEQEVVAGISQLYELMEGRVATTYLLDTDSILHVLRNNIHIDTAQNLRTDLGTITRIDYSDNIKTRTQEWFIEAHINYVAHFLQTR